MSTPDTFAVCASAIPDAADAFEHNASRMIALLRKVSETAADDFPWPQGYPPACRHLPRTDAEGTLAGLRVVQELMLAAERSRHIDDEYVGDPVMDGLMQACIALSAHTVTKLLPL
jgi:hypothetical protein